MASSAVGFEVPGLSPLVTPNNNVYRIDTALAVPHIGAQRWRLRVTGMVDRPYELTFAELLAMPAIEEPVTLACVSNEVGGDLVGNAVWRGIPLAGLLARSGVRPGARRSSAAPSTATRRASRPTWRLTGAGRWWRSA